MWILILFLKKFTIKELGKYTSRLFIKNIASW